MIIDIKSTNPDLGWCLEKNPATWETAPYSKGLRRGRILGWFPTTTHFRLWFRDHPVESSFARGSRGDFEYLDTTRYSSPQAALSVLSEALKRSGDGVAASHDLPFEATVSAVIWCGTAGMEWAVRSLTNETQRLDVDPVMPEEIGNRLLNAAPFRLTAKAATVHQALNVFASALIFQCMKDDDCDLRFNEDVMTKYAKVLNSADAPPMMKQRFMQGLIHNRVSFERIAEVLKTDGVKYCFGNTQVQRHDAISTVLRGGESLIDIGCGEGSHLAKLAGKYTVSLGIDREEGALHKRNRAKIEAEDGAFLHRDLTAAEVKELEGMFEGADVLITEVLEHNEKSEALALLNAVLETDANKVVITVPNKDFNKHYGLTDDKTRHHDHQWEPTKAEFSEFVNSLDLKSLQRIYTMHHVGTEIHGDATCLMVVFSPKVRSEAPALPAESPILTPIAASGTEFSCEAV